jgi:hypothetical protein
MKILKTLLIFSSFLVIFSMSSSPTLARSGCCSHHGGVASCDNSAGRQVCNDGTYSPSCTCSQEPQVILPTLEPDAMNKFLDDFAPYSTPTEIPIPTPTLDFLQNSAGFAFNNGPVLLLFLFWGVIIISVILGR